MGFSLVPTTPLTFSSSLSPGGLESIMTYPQSSWNRSTPSYLDGGAGRGEGMDGGNGECGTMQIGGGVSCTLKLDMELERVVNVGVFKEEVANDVATALGMNPARVRVVEVHPHTDVDTSSIYVDIQLNPDIYSSEKKLVAQLVVQSQDRSSVLMCGKRTSRTISVSRTQDVGSSSYSYSPQHTDDGEVSWIVSPPNTEATVDFLKVPSPVVISRGESLDISSVDISMSESKVQGPSSAVTQYDEQKSEEERAAAEWEEKWEQESAKVDEERERRRVRMLAADAAGDQVESIKAGPSLSPKACLPPPATASLIHENLRGAPTSQSAVSPAYTASHAAYTASHAAYTASHAASSGSDSTDDTHDTVFRNTLNLNMSGAKVKSLQSPTLQSLCLQSPNRDEKHVCLKVKGQDGIFVGFKIEKTTLLKTLIEAYCTCQGLEVKRICLFLDGKRVRETQTPAELDLQDDDVMEAHEEEHVMEAQCEKGHYDYEKAQKPSERDRSTEINLSMVCKSAAIDVMQHLMDRIARFDLIAAKNIVALMQHSPLSAADEIINVLTPNVKEMARSHTQLTFEEDHHHHHQQQKAEEASAQEASAPRPCPIPSPSGSSSSRASSESCRQMRRSSCSVIDSLDGVCPNAECVPGELKMRVAGALADRPQHTHTHAHTHTPTLSGATQRRSRESSNVELDNFELNESRHWSDEEHLRFLEAIQKFGHKQVEAIATNFVGQKLNFVAPGGHLLEGGHPPSVNDPQTLWQERSAHFAGAHPPPVSDPQTEFANAQEPTWTHPPASISHHKLCGKSHPQTLWQEPPTNQALGVGRVGQSVSSHPQTLWQTSGQEPTWTPRAFANFSSKNSGEGRGREVKEVEEASKPQPQGLCSAEPVVIDPATNFCDKVAMRALGFEPKPPSPPAAAAAAARGGKKGIKEGVCMWRQAYDPSHSQVNYLHTATGESKWEAPEENTSAHDRAEQRKASCTSSLRPHILEPEQSTSAHDLSEQPHVTHPPLPPLHVSEAVSEMTRSKRHLVLSPSIKAPHYEVRDRDDVERVRPGVRDATSGTQPYQDASDAAQYDQDKSEEERAAAEWEEKWEQESAKIDEERERSRVRMLVFESQLAQDHPRGENDDGAEMVDMVPSDMVPSDMVPSDKGAVGLLEERTEENDCRLGVKKSEKLEGGRRAMPTRRPSHGEIVGLQPYNFSPPQSR